MSAQFKINNFIFVIYNDNNNNIYTRITSVIVVPIVKLEVSIQNCITIITK